MKALLVLCSVVLSACVLQNRAAPSAEERIEWVCPMDPEVREKAPVPCPICGMALEPRTGAGVGEESHELLDMTRRFRSSAGLAIPLLALAMAEYVLPIEGWLTPRSRVLMELLLAAPICLWAAWPFYVRAVQSLKNRRLNMFTLIGLGVFVAYVVLR